MTVVRGPLIAIVLQVGIYVYDSGKGTIENNRITGHVFAEVQIRSKGNPKVLKFVFLYDYTRPCDVRIPSYGSTIFVGVSSPHSF